MCVTNLPYFKKILFVFNQQITKDIKGEILTIFLEWHPISGKGGVEDIIRCPQIPMDQFNDLFILLKKILATFT